ncbi:hypothetical protein [Parabacteroides goldsteinii]|uniref:hypothetical protein n=1 Tax=Parabacteroides goldsteinii TaxID=328812 RepID=UPI0026744316|nr:hypothetical protein [Parabacteroides goldsteinii]
MLIYVRTGCGLRTVISIIGIFEEVTGEPLGKLPCYNSVANWVRKLGLSVYEDDAPQGGKYAHIIDESIMINKEKLLVVLGVPAEHTGKPLNHDDVTILGMHIGNCFKRNDVKEVIDKASEKGISDGAHNLVGGFKDAGIAHHLDISHTLGNCMKHVYGKDADFVSLTEKLGKIRLQYHLTDKAWLLPPNMRAMARFMKLREWVTWGQKMLGCLDSLNDDMKEAYSFLLQYRDLIDELGVCVESVTYLETLCKREGFGLRTNALCQHHIIRNLIGNATNRRACVGLRMLDYFKRQAAVLNDSRQIRNISSDIIESEFGILKSKVSSNKLHGFTPMILMLPLYPKIAVYSDAKKQNFKVRLANVKLKDIDLWAKENLSPNRVALRSRTLNNAS